MGLGVSECGGQGRGLRSAALAVVFGGLALSGMLSGCGLLDSGDGEHGPKTGPGLEPPGDGASPAVKGPERLRQSEHGWDVPARFDGYWRQGAGADGQRGQRQSDDGRG